ncbi:hypothetical protein EOPP23_17300 [Endozoicomonas sp. OPT23]|uniref:TIGR01620 family protein n=1 Tax=Endozoicomonas sp. OPT23 TaxID=2072845 RepID=UPI00129B2F9E|nr:TIGR01620 family protein [Endozoicomonas sp. OPT23]MRI34741.1 hypothetical protein [Endozoicomonas sp. OPT23]
MKEHDQYFERLDETVSLQQPQTLVSDSGDLSSEAQSTFSLKPGRLRFLKPLIITIIVWLLFIGGLEFYQTFQELLGWHWGFAAAFGMLGVAGLILLISVVRQLGRNKRDLVLVSDLQHRSDRLVGEKSYGQFATYLKLLKELYDGKPQAAMLQSSLEKMPDYNNDAEAVEYLSTSFLAELDKAAVRCIAKHSEQTALMVAVSPLILIDMLLALWRSAKMLDEVSQIYGVRPSLLGRWQLMKEVLHLIAFSGASELISDHLVDLSTNELLGKLSTKLAQGVGAGLYTARIGYKAMDVCRPIHFAPDQRPKVSSELGQILSAFKKIGIGQRKRD